MPQHYDETFKKQIARLRLEEGRSIRSIMEEYGMSKASIINWCNEFREECQNNPESQNEYDSMKEIRKLRKEIEELRKENLFLKKQRHSLQRKSIRGLSCPETACAQEKHHDIPRA